MVATLLRIRFRVLGNTLARHPWQLVGFIFGTLWALGAVGLIAIGLLFLGGTGLEVTRLVLIAGGGLLTLGWVLAPVFAAGIDTTLDPARLATFPLTTSRMMVALTAAGLTGVPGMATVLGGLATFAAWWRWPLALLAAVVCVPVGILICVVASRTFATIAGGMTGGRRIREVVWMLAFVVLILAGPIFAGIAGLVRAAAGSSDDVAAFSGVLEAVSWTPLAAAWSAPGDLAAGAPLVAGAKLLIAVGTIVLLGVIWHRSLAASLIAPAARVGRQVAAGKLGWIGRLPTGGTGASWARSLTYWVHDPRYLRQLITVPLIPVLVVFWARGDMSAGGSGTIIAFSATFVAFVLGIAPYADVSYDGSAFASIVATGVRGRADRLGRMLGALTLGLPLVVVTALVTLALTGTWHLSPAIVGSSVGMLLTAYGVCAVSSAYLVVPVPAAGDNPFKRVPGATFSIMLGFLGVWILAGLLAAPEIVLAILAATTGQAIFGWLSLAFGLVLGIVFFVLGIQIGGRAFDRTAPDLLQRVRSASGS